MRKRLRRLVESISSILQDEIFEFSIKAPSVSFEEADPDQKYNTRNLPRNRKKEMFE